MHRCKIIAWILNIDVDHKVCAFIGTPGFTSFW